MASPQNNAVVIVVVVSFGGLLVGTFMLAICSCLNKRRRRRRKAAAAVDADVEGRVRVHEVVIPGPHGTKIEALDVEADVNVHERIRKDEIMAKGGRPHFHIADAVASEVARQTAVQNAASSTGDVDKDCPV